MFTLMSEVKFSPAARVKFGFRVRACPHIFSYNFPFESI